MQWPSRSVGLRSYDGVTSCSGLRSSYPPFSAYSSVCSLRSLQHGEPITAGRHGVRDASEHLEGECLSTTSERLGQIHPIVDAVPRINPLGHHLSYPITYFRLYSISRETKVVFSLQSCGYIRHDTALTRTGRQSEVRSVDSPA